MFKKDFLWGVATAAYQIEGSRETRGEDIWDHFASIGHHILDQSNGDIACDSYNRVDEDIELLKNLGVKIYRFSVIWSRILKDGIGPVNEEGLKYYINLIDKLLEADIIPMVTLSHFDLPLALMNKGGLLNDNIQYWFENYVDIVTKAFGDKVKYYCTINEPQIVVNHGYRIGIHAPGLKCETKEILRAIHNILLCHGRAVKVIRRNVKDSIITYAPCSMPPIPTNSEEELYNRCYEKYFDFSFDAFATSTSIYMDPVLLGDYPKKYYEMFKDYLPNITKEDLELISQPIDIISQNIYSGQYYTLNNNVLEQIPFERGYPKGDIMWNKVVPQVLYYGPKYLYQRYKKPIFISENGVSLPCWISLDGKVHDLERIDFIKRYIDNLDKVSKEIPITGYCYWSLMDNFEWSLGYTSRFGLVYIDYKNMKRTPKDSYYFYRDLIK